MSVLYELAILFLSLLTLPLFAGRLIDASVRIANALRVSKVVIGLTLLAYGSSLPEFAISTLAAKQYSAISIGNIFGSNIFNIAVVVGLMAFLGHVKVPLKREGLERDTWFLMGVVALMLSMLYLNNGLGMISGILFVSLLVLYSLYLIRKVGKDKARPKADRSISTLKELAMIVFCLAGVLVSGRFAIDSAVNIAGMFGISQWVIGATILAVGTSLPELVISLAAIRKGEFGMSLGNIVGSCLFNILWVLGIAAWIHPLTISFGSIFIDSLFLIASTGVLLFCILTKRFTRSTGALLLLMYLSYIAYVLL